MAWIQYIQNMFRGTIIMIICPSKQEMSHLVRLFHRLRQLPIIEITYLYLFAGEGWERGASSVKQPSMMHVPGQNTLISHAFWAKMTNAKQV